MKQWRSHTNLRIPAGISAWFTDEVEPIRDPSFNLEGDVPADFGEPFHIDWPRNQLRPCHSPLCASHRSTDSYSCTNLTCTNTTRVVSVSLYGSNERYTSGALTNARIAREAFPDWQLRIYIPDDKVAEHIVPDDVQAQLKDLGADVILLPQTVVQEVGFGMNQRFLVADDPTVDKYAVRDGDSRLLLRERWAMDEWEAS